MTGVDERDSDGLGEDGMSAISVLRTRLDFFFGLGATEAMALLVIKTGCHCARF